MFAYITCMLLSKHMTEISIHLAKLSRVRVRICCQVLCLVCYTGNRDFKSGDSYELVLIFL